MIIYNKLIRDKIPAIIKASGNKCEIKKLNDEEYMEELNKKLQEELNEYLEDGSLEELADIVEVIHAIVKQKGSTIEELERIRIDKRKKRGGFRKKLLLVSAEER